SFSRAASEMGITRAALSQNLKSLEERLNTKLIYRTTRNMSLTEEGQRLYEVLVSALGQIDDALKDVGDTQLEPTGLLRINSSRVAARMLVEPHIGEFLTRYPKT
ncbi:LysR family transcriptional regulator, partial [Escherichia coli]